MRDLVIAWSMLFIPGIVLWIWEKKDPSQEIKYSGEALKESKSAAIMMVYIVIVAYAYSPLQNLVIPPSLIEAVGWTNVLSIPLFIRIIIAIFLRELSLYVIHWQMHNSRLFWQTHKWHHSIEKMWWLSGQKSSLVSRWILRSTILWFPLLAIPAQIIILFGVVASVHNTMCHLNVKWRSWMKVVEWIIATPRYHHVHHLSNPQFHGKNLGALFTLFDRIFGTYVDPDTIDHTKEQFGLDGEPVTVKMIVGV